MPQRGTPPPVVLRRPVIGVMGSGREQHAQLSAPLGTWLAGTGCHLLTGGGRGVMECVSRTFSECEGREGLIIGVVPALPGSQNEDNVLTPSGYPNPYTEIVIRTQCPLSMHPMTGTELTSRNHINILSSDIVIALPGSSGTWSEIQLAIRYRKPLILFLGEDGQDVELQIEEYEDIKVAKSLEELQIFVEEALERRHLRASASFGNQQAAHAHAHAQGHAQMHAHTHAQQGGGSGSTNGEGGGEAHAQTHAHHQPLAPPSWAKKSSMASSGVQDEEGGDAHTHTHTHTQAQAQEGGESNGAAAAAAVEEDAASR